MIFKKFFKRNRAMVAELLHRLNKILPIPAHLNRKVGQVPQARNEARVQSPPMEPIQTYRGRRQTVLLLSPFQKPFDRGYPTVFLSFRFFSFTLGPLLAPRKYYYVRTIDGSRSPGVQVHSVLPLKRRCAGTRSIHLLFQP